MPGYDGATVGKGGYENKSMGEHRCGTDMKGETCTCSKACCDDHGEKEDQE